MWLNQFWYRYKTWIIVIGIFLMLVILGLLIKSIIEATKAPKSVNYKAVMNANGEIILAGSDGKPLDPLEGFDVVPFTEKAVKAITETCWWYCEERCKTYEEILRLTDNQLIAFANRFKSLTGQRVIDAMNANYQGCNWATYGYSSGYVDWDWLLEHRMIRLGL